MTFTTEWLAGFFDGEGCVYLQMDVRQNRRSCYGLQISLTQKTREILDAVCKVYGGRVHLHKGSKYNAYRWTVVSRNALPFLQAIQPYVVLKREQVDIAILFAQSLIMWGGSSGPPCFKRSA